MLSNHPIHHFPKSFPKTLFRLAAVAALAGASLASQAANGGEALDIEMPSMRSPVEASAAPSPTPGAAALLAQPEAAQRRLAQPLTRAQVRESLAMAKLANMVGRGGEVGDGDEVLMARENFNALQTEVIEAEYRTAALRLQQQQSDALMAQAQDYDPVVPGAAPEVVSDAGPMASQAYADATSSEEQGVEVVVVPSNKAYELLVEKGPAEEAPTPQAPSADAVATESRGTILMLVNEGKAD